MRQVPFFWPLLFAMLGILIFNFFNEWCIQHIVWLSIVFLVTLGMSLVATRFRSIYLRNTGLLIVALLTICLFIIKLYLSRPEQIVTNTKYSIQGVVLKSMKHQENYVEYLVDMRLLHKKNNWQKIKPTMAVLRQSDVLIDTLLPGDVFTCEVYIKTPKSPELPWVFDRAYYLRSKNIHYLVYPKSVLKLNAHFDWSYVVLRCAEISRRYVLHVIQSDISNLLTRGLIQAMLLGYKDDISPDTFQVFSDTGALHILAVSGMHVAVIYAGLAFAFGFSQADKKNKRIKGVLIFLCIWFFVCVTGCSASAVRAGTMLSIWLWSDILSRKRLVLNTLCFTAFVLLFVEPYWLFDTGFHLSFLAVSSIIFYTNAWTPSWLEQSKIMSYLFGMAMVSIAAQVGTLFASGYYFEKIPIYFLPANIVAVPVATCLIYLGVLYLLIPISIIRVGIVFIIDKLVFLLYGFIDWLCNLKYAVFEFPLHYSDAIMGSIFVLGMGVYVYSSQAKILRLSICWLVFWMSFSLGFQVYTYNLAYTSKIGHNNAAWVIKNKNSCLLILNEKNANFIRVSAVKKWLGVRNLVIQTTNRLPDTIKYVRD